jgi:hypothetical protein
MTGRPGLFLLTVSLATCEARPPCNGIVCAPACPRDAAPDTAGRCTCLPGTVALLGACVPPAVGDFYCGPAATIGPNGCVFRPCADGELLDAATGACSAKVLLAGAGSVACGAGGAPVLVSGRVVCVTTDAACPRGTDRVGAVCPRPPGCPPGSLGANGRCDPVVTVGARDGISRVDLGAWIGRVLGPDGGPGTAELCRPLALRPDAFGLSRETEATVTVRISVDVLDQDVARVHAAVSADLTVAGAPRPMPAEAEAVVTSSLQTLIEVLRGLGGEASTGAVALKVRCPIARTR